MSSFKLRLRSSGAAPPSPSVPELWAGPGYNGTAGSGWGVSGGIARPTPSTVRAVTDPARPTLSCAEDDREAFTEDHLYSFFSVAEHTGVGIGVSHVAVACEGNVVNVTEMSARSRTGFDLVTRDNEWGQHVKLKHASFPMDGFVEIFATAYPTDPAKDPVTIGPFLIKRKTGAYYDATLTVGDGQTYSTLNAAIIAAGSLTKPVASGGSGYDHVRIKPVGNLTYDPVSSLSLSVSYVCKGNLDISCDPGSSLHITKATNGGMSASNQFGFDFEGTRFGYGVKLDFARMNTIFAAYSNTNQRRAPSLCGCEVYNSNGANDMSGSSLYDAEQSPRDDGGITGGVQGLRCFEVYWHDMHIGPVAAQQLRNVLVENCTQDQLHPTKPSYATKLSWTHWYGVTITGFSLVVADTATDAIDLTGPTTVTYQVLGDQPNTIQKQVVFKRDGVEVWRTSTVTDYTIVSGVFTPVAGQYYVADVVNQINAQAAAATTPGVGMNGVSATLLSNVKRAAALTGPNNLGINNPTPPTALSGTPTKLVTRLDIHGDSFQSKGGHIQNLNIVNLSVINGAGQMLFNDCDTVCDLAWVNCIHSMSSRITSGWSTEDAPQSHVMHWNDTFIGITLRMVDYSPDSNTGYRNGIFSGLQFQGTPADDVVFDGMFLLQDNGEATPTTSGVGTLHVGGTLVSLLSDGYNGGFVPQAAVLAHLKPALVPFDNLGVARGAMTAAGARVASVGT